MKKRTLFKFIVGAAFAVGLAGAAHAEDDLAKVKAAGVMKVGTETEFAPFDYIDAGAHVGLNVDLFEEIGKEMGVKIEWVSLPWDGVLPASSTWWRALPRSPRLAWSTIALRRRSPRRPSR